MGQKSKLKEQKVADAKESFSEAISGSGSGSGSIDIDDEDENVRSTRKETSTADKKYNDDDEDDSGSTNESSGELTDFESAKIDVDNISSPKNVKIAGKGKENKNEILQNTVHLNSKIPSASRSAIPTPAEQMELRSDSDLKTYFHEDSRYDDDDNDVGDLGQFDEDEDADIKNAQLEGMADYASDRNTQRSISMSRGTTTRKSSNYQTTKTQVRQKDRGKEQKKKIIVPASGLTSSKKNTSNFKKLIHLSVRKEKVKTFGGARSKGHKTGLMTRNGQSQNIHSQRQSRVNDYYNSDFVVKDAKALLSKIGLSVKADLQGKDDTVRSKARHISSTIRSHKDFNDVTRAIITSVKIDKAKNAGKKASNHEVWEGKTGLKKNWERKKDVLHPETELQKELSTLFADGSSQFGKSSVYQPSRKSSFEKVRKIQDQRDRKRHHSRDHASLCKYEVDEVFELKSNPRTNFG